MTAPAPALAARGVTTPALALALATVDTFRNQIVHCDALTLLRSLPSCSVHCVITSPPYYGLRSYLDADSPLKGDEVGLEETPEQYVARLVEIMREARRVLHETGVAFVNLGDTYAASRPAQVPQTKDAGTKRASGEFNALPFHIPPGLKPKDLIGIPWRVAFALQADGWYLRADLIWAKPNPMPESVTDRPTKAHEYIFLLTKNARYWYDADAIREPHARLWNETNGGNLADVGHKKNGRIETRQTHPNGYPMPHPLGRNKRSVWTVATQPSPIPHFAMFPPALIEPCVLAGCPAEVCAECGAPYERVVEREANKVNLTEGMRQARRSDGVQTGGTKRVTLGVTEYVTRHTLGFRPTCDCHAATRPGIVLDPFMGVGTTALVAIKHGRDYIGGDLNAASVEWARLRIAYGGDDRRMMADKEAGVRQMTLVEAAR